MSVVSGLIALQKTCLRRKGNTTLWEMRFGLKILKKLELRGQVKVVSYLSAALILDHNYRRGKYETNFSHNKHKQISGSPVISSSNCPPSDEVQQKGKVIFDTRAISSFQRLRQTLISSVNVTIIDPRHTLQLIFNLSHH
jgi:Pyruvate/2-oxoacid:ferredoxin oxidoreductase gamma subunit